LRDLATHGNGSTIGFAVQSAEKGDAFHVAGVANKIEWDDSIAIANLEKHQVSLTWCPSPMLGMH
jgi:hypothetical protein